MTTIGLVESDFRSFSAMAITAPPEAGVGRTMPTTRRNYTKPDHHSDNASSASPLDTLFSALSQVTESRYHAKANAPNSVNGSGNGNTRTTSNKRGLSSVLATYEDFENSPRRKNPRNISPSPQHATGLSGDKSWFSSTCTSSMGGMAVRNEPCRPKGLSKDDEQNVLVCPKGTVHMGLGGSLAELLAPPTTQTRVVPPSA